MALSTFTDNEVFSTPLVNLYCNVIITKLAEATTTSQYTGGTNFSLTGTAAKIVHGDTPEPVKNVSFITDNINEFNFLRNNIVTILSATDVIKKTDIIYFKVSGYFFELHFQSAPFTAAFISGVRVQKYNDIPNYIL